MSYEHLRAAAFLLGKAANIELSVLDSPSTKTPYDKVARFDGCVYAKIADIDPDRHNAIVDLVLTYGVRDTMLITDGTNNRLYFFNLKR